MKKVNVYNSNWEYSIVILLGEGERVTINPKENIEIEVETWFGKEGFKLENKEGLNWKEAYMGRYNQNLILGVEY